MSVDLGGGWERTLSEEMIKVWMCGPGVLIALISPLVEITAELNTLPLWILLVFDDNNQQLLLLRFSDSLSCNSCESGQMRVQSGRETTKTFCAMTCVGVIFRWDGGCWDVTYLSYQPSGPRPVCSEKTKKRSWDTGASHSHGGKLSISIQKHAAFPHWRIQSCEPDAEPDVLHLKHPPVQTLPPNKPPTPQSGGNGDNTRKTNPWRFKRTAADCSMNE